MVDITKFLSELNSKLQDLKGIAYRETAKSHVFLLMQISYPYIFWNNVPKFQENGDMRKSMCVIVVGEYHYRGGSAQTRSLSVQKNEKITRTIPILKYSYFFSLMDIKSLQIGGGQTGGQGALSVQKNEKITRTVPILK